MSIQVRVALVGDDAERAEVIERDRRRFGDSPMHRGLVAGTAPELVDHFAGLRSSGVERFYVWFADFAPVETLQRFGAVLDAAN